MKVVAKQLLGPTLDLVNGTVICKNFPHSTAVAKPIKFVAPEEFPILTDALTTTGSLADKRMEVAFTIRTPAGAESDWSKAGTAHLFK